MERRESKKGTRDHPGQATGITAYLENGGTIEHAQQIANHEVAEDHQAL